MKDYYYFLGIAQDASDDEIRKAYRKLSLKYHPDKNPQDSFFENRFREVQEAYDQLIDPEKRRFYDSQLMAAPSIVRTTNPPVIRSLSSNKIRVKKGDEIILNWETLNADLVKILPFGLEKTSGERSFKINEFKDGKFHAVLQATNTFTRQSVVKGITFVEVFDTETEVQTTKFEAEEFYKPDASEITKKSRKKALWIIAVIIILTLLIGFILNIQA